ncbi:hypothetical protein BC939DRAFT_447885, partial [Gamsiella multidivaricata]|uniref:uncharacterized protein n=1 Tax=Gamsiella multidivaricata TaxID=101098 RepID=UPI002220CABE
IVTVALAAPIAPVVLAAPAPARAVWPERGQHQPWLQNKKELQGASVQPMRHQGRNRQLARPQEVPKPHLNHICVRKHI